MTKSIEEINNERVNSLNKEAAALTDSLLESECAYIAIKLIRSLPNRMQVAVLEQLLDVGDTD